jgi:COP9 signalosome complex subunit 3, N-terminal helical repeats
VLNYHYTGALALLALKRFSQASTYLELVAAAPVHQSPAALQLEALKKLTLVRLILFGAVSVTEWPLKHPVTLYVVCRRGPCPDMRIRTYGGTSRILHTPHL